MAMNAYRNYNNNNKALSGNLEKLSSGYKINRAGDDAAGLAISEKMRAQITGLEAAQKNVKDGTSLVKTAEGAMQEIHDMLNRMDYLATQSANGTYQDEVDRENLQKEVDALKTEIDRIADSANFNGIKLLDGSIESKAAVSDLEDAAGLTVVADGQLGKAPQAGIYTVNLHNLVITNNGTSALDPGATFNGAALKINTADKIAKGGTMTGDEYADAIAAYYDGSSTTKTFSIEDTAGNKIEFNVTANNGVLTFEMTEAPKADFKDDTDLSFVLTPSATMSTNQAEEFGVEEVKEAVSSETSRKYAQAQLALTDADITDGRVLKIGDTSYTFAVGKDSAYKGGKNVIDLTDIEEGTEDISVTAARRLTTAASDNKNFLVGTDYQGTLTFTEKEGGVDYSVNNLAGADNKWTKATDGTSETDATAEDWSGLIQFGNTDAAKSTKGLTLQIGDTADSFNQMTVSVGDMHIAALGIDKVDISTQDGAQKAIQIVKDAINQVSSVRGDLGAIQNRLDHTGNNLSVMAENIQDAESTIRDTDVAEEMMSYVKNNILVQSAQAMLAQANQVPQGVLQLLG